jgi:hypothetical protein
MPIFGSHSSAVTPSKSRLISGPMHARHLGGVSITGGTGGNTSLESYFAPTSLEPDELPSHTYAASGTTEVPRRSRTFTNTVRRPSLSLKRSISRLRSGSGSCASEGHKRSQSDNRPVMMSVKSEPAVPHMSQIIQRKASPVPNRMVEDLDRNSHGPTTWPKSPVLRQKAAPPPPPKDYPQVDLDTSTYSKSAYFTGTNYDEAPRVKRTETAPPLPVRPKRADSGTAVDFDSRSLIEKPKSFKDILAIQNYKDRMALYEKTRNYWANAEHGLAEWTGRSGGPRTVQLRKEERWV